MVRLKSGSSLKLVSSAASACFETTHLNSRNLFLWNSLPSSGMLVHKLPCLQIEDVPSIAKRTVRGAALLGVK